MASSALWVCCSSIITDIIIRRSGMQVGSMYLGVVGLVSRERRQSIVYLGGQLSGTLPMGPDDRGPDIGARIPVRIEALGQRARRAPAVERRAHRAGPLRGFEHVFCRAHQQADHLGSRRANGCEYSANEQETNGWGIIWRTAAQNATDDVLER